MATYGRYEVIGYSSFFVITDMQTHNWVSAKTGDIKKARDEAARLQILTEKVPPSALRFFIQLLEKSAMIERGGLYRRIRSIIDAAAENANEYLEDPDNDGDDWVDAFKGTVEVKCEEASEAERWFAEHFPT